MGKYHSDNSHFEVSLVNANFQFRSVLLQLGDELLGDPLLVILTIGDEHIVETAHVLLLHVPPLPPLLHQPK